MEILQIKTNELHVAIFVYYLVIVWLSVTS